MAELISIALCTYNSGKFLEPLLDSLLNQTWRPLEIVCVDDASTDSTVQTLQRYNNNHPGIFKLTVNEKNLGYIKNFEKCIRLCSADHIAIADHDDIWLPGKLERLRSAIGEAMMVYSDSALIDVEGKRTGRKISDSFRLHNHPSPEAFAFYDFIWGHTTLIKKKLLDYALPIPADMPYDSWLAFTAASTSQIEYVDEVLTLWRQHQDAFSTTMFQKNEADRSIPGWRYREFLKKKQRIYLLSKHPNAENPILKNLLGYYSELEKGFSFKLFLFLLRHHKQLFPIWRRNYFSRINEFRIIARGVKP